MTVRPFVLGDRAATKPLADGLHRLHTGNRPDVFTGEELSPVKSRFGRDVPPHCAFCYLGRIGD